MLIAVLALTAALVLVVAPTASPRSAAAPCTGSDLIGSFTIVPALLGEAYYNYTLRLKNTSGSPCALSGIPKLVLLTDRGRALPTRVVSAHPGAHAPTIVLAAGGKAHLVARLSPTLNDNHEPVLGQCEPTAWSLRVTPGGGGSVVVPMRPLTPVCEHGLLKATYFAAGW
jgi:Protein of unknown function (DUF4232)